MEQSKILAEYRQTLYSYEPIHVKKTIKPAKKRARKVDIKEKRKNLSKVGKKRKKIVRKVPNVIYVVSKPQPGQVRGDWAVRGHGKIYSHHRNKVVAIKHAKEIASVRNATVMIQKTDGKFSRGIKPRPKKK